MESASERWAALQQARKQQMDAAYARLGRTSLDFWDRRARRYHSTTTNITPSDPLFFKLKQEVLPTDSVLDVGAGTGRFTLALAPQAHHITAIEPNASMLSYLQHDASEKGLKNISTLQSTWQDAPATLTADIVICSHVLYPIEDIVPFLTKLQAATKRACYIYMRAMHMDAVLGDLWRHFHGDERQLPPTYIHALDVLYDMGIYADVEIVELPMMLMYPSLDVAVEELLEQLILPQDEATRKQLHSLLEQWLVPYDGMLGPPIEKIVGAIIQIKAS